MRLLPCSCWGLFARSRQRSSLQEGLPTHAVDTASKVFSFAAEVDLRHLLLQDIEMQSCASNIRSEPSKPRAAAPPPRGSQPVPLFASSTLTKRICYTPPSQASFGSSDEALQCRLNRAELVFQLDHRDELLRHHFLQNLQSGTIGAAIKGRLRRD